VADFDQARNFVMTVKTRFAQQPDVYKQFLNILHDYHKEGLTIAHVHAVVNELFFDQPDLQEGFRTFLPADKSL
jgi:paired amphipathic helix protein Sin3a